MPDYYVPILVDECVTNRVAIGLRNCGYKEAFHVTEVGRRGKDDDEQLEYAAENGMAVLTYNIEHFAELHNEWALIGRPHCGILLAQDFRYQRHIGGLINDVRSTLRYYDEVHGGAENWIHNGLFYVRHL